MDEATEGSVAASWSDVGKFQWKRNQHLMSTPAMNMMPNNSFFDHEHILCKYHVSGCAGEKQGLTLDDFSSSSHLGINYSTMHRQHHQQAEDGRLLAAHLKQGLRVEGGSCITQTQSNGPIQPVFQEFPEVPHGSLRLPKLERSASIGSSVGRPTCQEMSHTFQPALPFPNGGGILSSSSSSGVLNGNSSPVPEGSPYFAKGPWIDEVRSGPFERRFHLSEQAHVQHVRSTSQQPPSQPHGAAVLASGPTRPRTRARRGQATDPHSIAERKRREKITNAMKDLQELVPTLNKADRIAFVEDVIEYVKFLRVQAKVFIMSRLSTTGASFVAETAAQGQDGLQAVMRDVEDHDMASAEEEIAQLLEEDIGGALRSLQSKGLCMMPIPLAAVMPIHDTMQPTGLANSTT